MVTSGAVILALCERVVSAWLEGSLKVANSLVGSSLKAAHQGAKQGHDVGSA
jgi:hypothetical protein